MGSAGSVGAQAVGVGQGSGEVTLQLTPQWSLGMGVRSRVGGVFPGEGTACGEEGLERRAEGRPGGRRLVFGGRLASLCPIAPCARREVGSRLENPGAKVKAGKPRAGSARAHPAPTARASRIQQPFSAPPALRSGCCLRAVNAALPISCVRMWMALGQTEHPIQEASGVHTSFPVITLSVLTIPPFPDTGAVV